MAILNLPVIITSPIIVRGAVIDGTDFKATLHLAEIEELGTILSHVVDTPTLSTVTWQSNDAPLGLSFGVANVFTSARGLALGQNSLIARSITSTNTTRTTTESQTFSNIPAGQSYFKPDLTISTVISVTVNGTATTDFTVNPALFHVQLGTGVPANATVVINYNTDNVYHFDYATIGSVQSTLFDPGRKLYRLKAATSIVSATADRTITLASAAQTASTGFPIEIPGGHWAFLGPTDATNSLAGLFI